MRFDEGFPVAGGTRVGQRTRELVEMAHGNGQGVGRIEEFCIEALVKRLLHQQFHLLLRGVAPPGDGHLDLTRGIFENRDLPVDRRGDGRSLRPAELEHRLDILSEERRFNSHIVRRITVHDFPDAFEDPVQLQEMVFLLAHIQHAHVHIVDAPFIYENDPVTKQIGSGVDAEYDPLLSRHGSDDVEAGVFTQHLRHDDVAVGRLIVFDDGCQDTREGQRTAVERMGQLRLAVFVLIAEFQAVGLV